jgi:3-oxoadipate enol-lactonase
MVLIRGSEIGYNHSGTGLAFVWGHGLTSSMKLEDQFGLVDWATVRESSHLLRYDARGHGTSGSTEAPSDYSWDELAHDQLALADVLGIDSYVAGGASMGCGTALHAAVIAPDRIAALVLVIPPTAWATRAAQSGGYLVMADMIEAGRFDVLIKGASERPAPDPFRDDPGWAERFPNVLANTDPVRLARVFRGAATADLPSEAELASIAVPTLILAWTGDPGHPASMGARLQELIPHSELALAASPDGIAQWTGRITRFVAGL